MGLFDTLKDKTMDLSGSAFVAMDKSKLDSQIREEQKKIEGYTKDIGDIVVKSYKDGSKPDESAMKKLYDNILESEKKIEDLESEKDGLKSKYEEEKAIRDRERTAKELEDAQTRAAEAAAKAETYEKKE